MSPEAQRIAIAEACGWTNIDKYLGRQPLPFTQEFIGGTNDGLAEGEDTLGHDIKPLPDYLEDLNGMNEAVNTHVEKEGFPFQERYTRELRAVITRRRRGCNEMQMDFWMAEATAAQRAESLLRTIEKWEDAK